MKVSVYDTGKQPVTVQTSVLNIRKQEGTCGVRAGGVPGVTITPARFTLKPGQHGTATVRVARNAPGADLAVIFASDPPPGAHLTVRGAVASQLVINGKQGRTPACVSVRRHPRPVAAFPYGEAGGLAGAGVCGVGFVLWAVRRNRRRAPYERRHALAPVK